MSIAAPPASPVAAYVCAAASVAVALTARILLTPVVQDQFPFSLFYMAVVVAAWYGGFRPALLALVLGGVAAEYFLLDPKHSFMLMDVDDVVGMAMYLTTSVGIAVLSGSMVEARREAEHAANELLQQRVLISSTNELLEARVLERTQELTRANARLLQSQDQWQTSEAHFRSYLENAPIGILVANESRQIIEGNRAAANQFQYRPEELETLTVDNIHLPENRPAVERAFVSLAETGYSDGFYKLVRRDGTQFWASLRAAALPDGGSMAFLRDISEEKRIADELRIERDWFATVVTTVPVVICSFRQRPDGKWSSPFPNPGIETVYGIAPELLSEDASPMFAAMHPADAGRVAESILESARTMMPWHCDFRVNNPTRGEIWVEGQSVPTKEPDGSILWHGYIADITARKRTEEALRTSETRLRLLVEGVSDYAIFMLDPEGNVLTWHKGAEQVYGYEEAGIVGRHYSVLFPLQAIASGKPRQELVTAVTAGTSEVEGWRVRKNGMQFWVTGTVTAVHDSEGKVIAFAKVTRDITVKRRNDELLHSVLDHTLDGIITIDDHGTISTINHAGEQIFGHRGIDLVGENVRRLMPEPDRGRHDTYISNYVHTGHAKIIGIGREVRGLRKDGTTFPMDLAITEFRLDDHRYFVGIVRDISEQKKLEAQLFQSQKMEAFGQLAGGVAHDFNNLLTLINGYSQILQRMVPATDTKQKMLGQIFRAGQRAASLTQQLLAFSRQQVLEPKVLDINSIVLDAEILLRRLIGEDIELATVLYPHVSAVKADPGQIEQVIMNLAVNARDAMPLGGKLTIETSEVDISDAVAGHASVPEPGRYVTIAISDTGTGMPPEVRSRVFEPFFTTKGVGKGTGLGLAVAHGIVKQSGGTIDIYSEVGVGTTFKIRLPALGGVTANTTEHGPVQSTDGTETILLVEDDENVREFVAVALQSFGYSVLTASDGRAAIQVYANRKTDIDLVVTDVVMPEMSGRVLAETLTATNPRQKILFLSGYTDDAVVRHGILQAHVAFLQKPFTPDALARKVREVIDQA